MLLDYNIHNSSPESSSVVMKILATISSRLGGLASHIITTCKSILSWCRPHNPEQQHNLPPSTIFSLAISESQARFRTSVEVHCAGVIVRNVV